MRDRGRTSSAGSGSRARGSQLGEVHRVRRPGRCRVEVRGNLRLRGLAWWALAAAMVAAVSAGCTGTPHKEIDAIGVVASLGGGRSGDSMVDTYTFDDGRTYSMTYKVEGGVIEGGGVLPEVGDLLIAGSRPDNWMLVARPKEVSQGFPAGCYGLGPLAGEDRETTVELDFGVTLQKAPDYNPSGHEALAHFGDTSILCLDRQGRVMQVNP
jgi:hypothetical protein